MVRKGDEHQTVQKKRSKIRWVATKEQKPKPKDTWGCVLVGGEKCVVTAGHGDRAVRV